MVLLRMSILTSNGNVKRSLEDVAFTFVICFTPYKMTTMGIFGKTH